MAASQQKRGDKNRELDPLLARALERLRAHIKERGLSQTELQERSGLTQGHISKLLRGKNPEAAFVVIARLASAADVSIDWLVSEPPRLLASLPPPSKTG